MTQKHFKIIADTLADAVKEGYLEPEQIDSLIESFAQRLSQENPRFKPEYFRDYVLKQRGEKPCGA